MKRLLCCFLLIYVAGCRPKSSGQLDCSQLRNGKFLYRSELSGRIYSIDRSDSMQVETDQASGETSRWRLRWTENCAYQIEEWQSNDSSGHKEPIRFRVVKQARDYYIYEAKLAGYDELLSDTLFRIEK